MSEQTERFSDRRPDLLQEVTTDESTSVLSPNLSLSAPPLLPAGLVPTKRHIDLRALTYESTTGVFNSTNISAPNKNSSSSSRPETITTDLLLKTMECSICQAVLVEPRSTRCGHTFCAACLREALRVDPRCPVDRTPLRWDRPGDVTVAPLVVAGVVDELMVACPNAPAGCAYRCARGLVECHVWHDCRHTEVSCPGCGVPTERRVFEGNRSVDDVIRDGCPHTLETCGDCGIEMQRYRLLEHSCEAMAETTAELTTEATDGAVEDDESSALESITCPLCDVATTKRKLQTHLADTCTEATVGCIAGASLGCRWTGKRQAYTSRHSKNCHFVVLGPTLRRQNERLNRLQDENRQLKYKVDRLVMALTSAGLDCEGNLCQDKYNPAHPIPGGDASAAAAAAAEEEEIMSVDENRNANSAAGPEAHPDNNNINLSESDFMSLFMEGNRFRVELDRVRRSMEMRMVQEGFRTSEELVGLRAMVNGLRQQVNFLWMERRVNNNNNNSNNNNSFLHQHVHQTLNQNGRQGHHENYTDLEGDADYLTSMPRRHSDNSRKNVKL